MIISIPVKTKAKKLNVTIQCVVRTQSECEGFLEVKIG